MTILSLLRARLRDALAGIAAVDPQVTATADARFGDYQTNVAMTLARELRLNPRQLAQEIVEKLDLRGVCEPPEIAGAGFINFRLCRDFVAEKLGALMVDERLGVALPDARKKIVVDFSSPNVAKPMHVGHIRSTILGDAIARIAEFAGHAIIRDNHIGDWGTQFGMLLVGWKSELDTAALGRDPLAEMERIYKKISARCKEDPATLERARAELVRLQNGDEENLRLWREMTRLSETQFETIYRRLNVRFDVTLGESFFNSRLGSTIAALRAAGVLKESEGAWCVFSDDSLPQERDPFLIKDRDGWRANPAIVQKSDGAANYMTTDLATLSYRLEEWAPNEIVYVTDGRQQLHFRQLFAIFHRWQPQAAANVALSHVWFGSILGEDGKPFKTRTGESVRLSDLLDEAEERALAIVTAKNPGLPEEERMEIARIIGIGAVKYADLLPNRQSDYAFSWEKMLSLTGNTAPYLQNACVRIRSIFRKAGETNGGGRSLEQGAPRDPSERGADMQALLGTTIEEALAKKLLQFGESVPQVLDDYRPNLLANYLYEVATAFHRFFEECPVLRAEPALRAARLELCALTERILRHGLQLLGIEVPARM